MNVSETKELATALSAAQAEIENVKKGNVNPHFRSKYADLASVWDAIREPLTKNGLAVVQLPTEASEGRVALRTLLLHSSGQCVDSVYSIAIKDPSNPQVVGSALTYMKRYALLGLAGLGPEDDDGNAAKAPPTIAVVPKPPALPDAAMASEVRARTRGCKTATELRTLHGTVRASSIAEPLKSELLNEIATAVKGMK